MEQQRILVLSPYFGYTRKPGDRRVNNQGFLSDVSYPYHKEPGEFVVGVFGGSVAQQIAVHAASREMLQDQLLEVVAPQGYDRVRILSFSLGGWKQPQIFYLLVQSLNQLDLAMVVDGLNEIDPLSEQEAMKWPVVFPDETVYAALAGSSFSHDKLLAIGRIASLGENARSWTAVFDRPVLRNSLLAHAIWRARIIHLLSEIGEWRAQLAKGSEDASLYTAFRPNSPEEAKADIERYFQLYERLSRWQAQIARSEGLPLVHFLQPNQYVAHSKPYSTEEREKYLTWGKLRTSFVTARYQRLSRIFENLRSSGLHAYSLVDAFRDVQDTVYLDDCCHFNPSGLEYLAKRIVELIRVNRIVDAADGAFGGHGKTARTY